LNGSIAHTKRGNQPKIKPGRKDIMIKRFFVIGVTDIIKADKLLGARKNSALTPFPKAIACINSCGIIVVKIKSNGIIGLKNAVSTILESLITSSPCNKYEANKNKHISNVEGITKIKEADTELSTVTGSLNFTAFSGKFAFGNWSSVLYIPLKIRLAMFVLQQQYVDCNEAVKLYAISL